MELDSYNSSNELECQKENLAPIKQSLDSSDDEDHSVTNKSRTQTKRRVMSSSDEQSNSEKNTSPVIKSQAKRSKMDAEEVLTSQLADSSSDVSVDDKNIPARRKKKGRRKIFIPDVDSSSDEEPSSNNNKNATTETSPEKAVPDENAMETHSESSDLSSDAEDDDVKPEILLNKLSDKYKGPASKTSRTRRRTKAKEQDTQFKYYSEKQRMIREQEIKIPVYQPPKKTLDDFIRDFRPMSEVLQGLKPPLPPHKAATAPWQSKAAAADRGDAMSAAADDLKCVESSSIAESQPLTDTQLDADLSTPSSSSVTVTSKNLSASERLRERKKRLLAKAGIVIGSEVPQLSCDSDGLICLDDVEKTMEERKSAQEFRSKYEKMLLERAEEKRKEKTNAVLRAVKTLADGSQQELSMDTIMYKSSEDTKGVHKLSVLKEILTLQINQKRTEEMKRKQEMIKMEQLEEEEEELDDDFSDEAEEEDEEEEPENLDNDSDGESLSPANIDLPSDMDSQSISKSTSLKDVLKDEALVKRVKAVLESDEEAEDDEEESQPPVKRQLIPSQITATSDDSLQRLLELDVGAPTANGLPVTMEMSQLTQLPLGDADSQLTQQTLSGMFNNTTSSSSLPLKNITMDENAQDINSLLGFSSSVDNSDGKSCVKLGFTQDMFDTQQAENEILDLCSGQFSGGSSQDKQRLLQEDITSKTNDNANSTDVKLNMISKKKQALQFSDEEDDDTQELPSLVRENEFETKTHDAVDNESVISGGEENEDGSADEAKQSESDSEVRNENKSSFTAINTQKHRKDKKKRKQMKEYFEDEAELSGSEVGSDEDLDLDECDDILEVEMGDNDDVGSEDQLRSQVGKIHMKQARDEDAKQLMLMKELLLPDGDLHSDSRRQRKFRWRNVTYRDNDDGERLQWSENGESDSEENTEDPEVKELHKKLEKERKEREAWVKQQIEERRQHDLKELEEKEKESARISEEIRKEKLQQQRQMSGFDFSLDKKKKKPFIFAKSEKFIKAYKERHKYLTMEPKTTMSTDNRGFIFRRISKDQAEKQRNKLFDV